MLDLRHGTVVKTLIPKIAEGKTFQITLRNEEKVSNKFFLTMSTLRNLQRDQQVQRDQRICPLLPLWQKDLESL